MPYALCPMPNALCPIVPHLFEKGYIQTRIVEIDNSQGIHIPKSWLEQIGISGAVEIEVQGDRIVIRAALKPRSGWDEAFAKMAEQHDDVLLDNFTTTEWDEVEWEW